MRQDAGEAAAAGEGLQDRAAALARARIQLHYLAHDCFLGAGELLARLPRIGEARVLIVQGAKDRVCPPKAAREVAARLPQSELRLIQDGGHSATGAAIAAALRQAADDLRASLPDLA
jgi:proline iminopeptidase